MAGGRAKRYEYLIRGGYVLTLDARGDLPTGDVHIRDGAVVAVEPEIMAPDAEVIDAAGQIVMPGFVDTHWHLWNCSLRGLVVDGDPDRQYFPVTVALGPHFSPDDTYIATCLGATESIGAGITTVHDWSHNVRGPEYAEASLRALAECGLRGRFSYGWAQQAAMDRPMDVAGLAAVQGAALDSEWELLHLGMASRNVVPGQSIRGAVPIEIAHDDWSAARSLGLPITLHASPAGLVTLLEEQRLLGPDVLLVHPMLTSARENAIAADRGAAWSIAPIGEAARGPEQQIRLPELEKAGVRVGLSIDTTCTDSADMFAAMRILQKVSSNRLGSLADVTCRRLLQLATLEGARVLGVDHLVGSLAPGKRADIILVDRRAPNMAPCGDDVATQLVNFAQPANVRTVLVDGRVLLRDGRHTLLDVEAVVAAASDSAAAIRARAKWPAPANNSEARRERGFR